MYKTGVWRDLVDFGTELEPENIVVITQEKHVYPEEISSKIEENWIAALQRKKQSLVEQGTLNSDIEIMVDEDGKKVLHVVQQGEMKPAMWPGPMIRLEDFEFKNGKNGVFTIKTSHSGYDEMKATHYPTREAHKTFEKFGYGGLARTIGVSSAILTSDEKLVRVRRNETVAEYPDTWYCSGGAYTHFVENPFESMKAEYREEFGIQEGDIKDAQIVTMIENLHSLRPEIIFFSTLGIRFKEVLDRWEAEKARHMKEHMFIDYIEPVMLEPFLTLIEQQEFNVPGHPLFFYAGKILFGDGWAERVFSNIPLLKTDVHTAYERKSL